MANRAYLYAADCDSSEEWEPLDHGSHQPYYDSRWTIPLAWFFFFSPQNLVTVTEWSYHGESSWQVVKLAAVKEEAEAAFQRNRERLLALTGADEGGAALISHLQDKIASWSGTYLFMDPAEIVEDDEMAATEFVHFLRCVGDDKVNINLLGRLYRSTPLGWAMLMRMNSSGT